MSQTRLYAAVLAKIGAERSKLLGEVKIKTLSETSLQEFASQLRETTYQTQIAKLPLPLTSQKLERAFKENLIESYEKVIKISPAKARMFLDVYLLRFEIENIKALLKSTIANLSLEQKISKIYFSIEDYLKNRTSLEEAAKFSTIREVVSAFKIKAYASALSLGLQNYEKNRSTVSFDILLDQVFHEKLYETFQKLPKKEKPPVVFYASIETDSFLLLALLRGKQLHYDEDFLRTTIPYDSFNLTSDVVAELLRTSDFDSALEIILKTHYGKFFAKAPSPEEIIANAQRAFQKALLNHAKVNFVLDIFNIGAALSFMTLKEAEVHNLIALSAGVDGAVNSEEIQNQLLF